MELFGPLRERYLDFAAYAADDSPVLERWARGVADDAEVQAWLADLPVLKQQPNLVFAAARWHGLPDDAAYADLRALLLDDEAAGARVRATVLARATQTNEARRTATLLPALGLVAAQDGPVALLEAGASAGLCLYPDRWSYRFVGEQDVRLGPADGPLLESEVRTAHGGRVPWPDRRPEVRWRGGVDLNPLDVTDADTVRWLEALVWPEHDDRRATLRVACALAAHEPPELVRGDLLDALPGLVDRAAAHGRVVVQHTAVAAYLDEGARDRFHDLMTGLVDEGRCRWISNEGAHVLPRVAATGPTPPPRSFVLGLDGRAVAWTHGHGRSMTWFGGQRRGGLPGGTGPGRG